MLKSNLNKQEIEFLENLGIDTNSKNLKAKIQQILENGEVEKYTNFDNGGISKAVNWQGGGEFIYFELAKWNETAKGKILACESLEDLIKFFDEMYEKYFLNYNLKIKEFRKDILEKQNFASLKLDEQKKIFIAMLDNNQMYVNKTEMVDAKYNISEEDQRLTEEFYKNF